MTCRTCPDDLTELLERARACRICAPALGFEPRPFVAASRTSRLLIIGQAPGAKVHASGIGWDDDSGERLRGWLGLDKPTFYDSSRIAQLPSGLCYPGKASGGDKPPRPECAPLWHPPLMAAMPHVRLTLLVGRYAQQRYLPRGFARTLGEAVARWREAPPGTIPLPHPAWRSRLWMAKHPWFESELLPVLRKRVDDIVQPQLS